MSKRQMLMLIGAWVLLLAAPGFPPAWKSVLLVITGIGIIVFAYRMPAPASGDRPAADLPFTDYQKSQSDAPASTGDRPTSDHEETVA